MNEREFCYWLKGYFEIADPKGLTEDQERILKTIKDHLDLVFFKVTPDRAFPFIQLDPDTFPLGDGVVVTCSDIQKTGWNRAAASC